MKQLFATQIYHQKLLTTKNPLMSQLVTASQSLLEGDQAGHRWSDKAYKNGYTSYGSLDQLHFMSKPFAQLKIKLDLEVKKYIKQLHFAVKPQELGLSRLWLNVMPAHCYHAWHIHPRSVISGTFYLQMPPEGAPIRFEDPRLGLFMNRPLTKSKEADYFYNLLPQAGDIVLFESWLKHEVPMHLNPQDVRVSLSFNYDWV